MMKEILIGLLSLGVVIGARVGWVLARSKQRKQALGELAQQLGWKLRTEGLMLAPTSCFTGKTNPKVDNVIEGSSSGLGALMFDFLYDEEVGSVEGGDSTVTSIRTIAAFSNPEYRLPTFVLRKKGLLGSSDRVEVEGPPEFVKHMVLIGKDKQSISSLFNPELVNFLARTIHDEKLCLEGTGPWLVFYYERKVLGTGKRLPPKQWGAFLQEASQIASGFFQIAAKASPAAATSAR
jgi:hypothetical protein